MLGTQEGLRNQLDDIKNALPDYNYYGIGRDDGQAKGEHSAIFYKTAKFNVLKSGDFWLSATPEKPGPGWDAHLNRICSWVQLQDKLSWQIPIRSLSCTCGNKNVTYPIKYSYARRFDTIDRTEHKIETHR